MAHRHAHIAPVSMDVRVHRKPKPVLPKHVPQRPSLHILLQHALNLHSDDRLGHTLHDDHRQAQASPHSVRQSQEFEPTRRHK